MSLLHVPQLVEGLLMMNFDFSCEFLYATCFIMLVVGICSRYKTEESRKGLLDLLFYYLFIYYYTIFLFIHFIYLILLFFYSVLNNLKENHFNLKL